MYVYIICKNITVIYVTVLLWVKIKHNNQSIDNEREATAPSFAID